MRNSLIGLIEAAIVAATMSTHSGEINSLAGATMHVLYLPLTKRTTEGTTLRKRTEHRLTSAVPVAQLSAVEVHAARGAVWRALRYVGEME